MHPAGNEATGFRAFRPWRGTKGRGTPWRSLRRRLRLTRRSPSLEDRNEIAVLRPVWATRRMPRSGQRVCRVAIPANHDWPEPRTLVKMRAVNVADWGRRAPSGARSFCAFAQQTVRAPRPNLRFGLWAGRYARRLPPAAGALRPRTPDRQGAGADGG